MNDDRDDQDLLRRLIDGTLDGPGRARLQERLRQDPALRRTCRDQLQLHALLAWRQGQAPVQAAPRMGPRLRSRRRTILALAAGLVLAVGLAGLVLGRGDAGVPVEIVHAEGLAPGQPTAGRLRLADLELAQGSVQLLLPRGIQVGITGPARVRFLDPMHLQVLRGQVTAEVGDLGHGFRLDTPEVEIVDLGTRFGVEVGQGGRSDVVVFKGEIALTRAPGSTTALPERLREGEALRIAPRQPLAVLQQIVLDPHGWRWLADPPRCSPLITSVLDNRSLLDERRFYTVVPGGMGPGARAYTGGRGFWQALEGQPFPPELVGADAVRTWGPLRQDSALAITVTLAAPATVYVLMDASIKTPDWLARDFRPTGSRLRRDAVPYREGLPPYLGPAWIEFQVWKRTVPGAGPVVLGAPLAAPVARPGAMYGIAVGP